MLATAQKHISRLAFDRSGCGHQVLGYSLLEIPTASAYQWANGPAWLGFTFDLRSSGKWTQNRGVHDRPGNANFRNPPTMV